MRDAPSVVALVARAAGSDEDAWQELVDRYAPLVWSICVRYQLSSADIEDVGQTVWRGLVEQLGGCVSRPRWLGGLRPRPSVSAFACSGPVASTRCSGQAQMPAASRRKPTPR